MANEVRTPQVTIVVPAHNESLGLLRTLRASGAVVDHVASGSEADAALLTKIDNGDYTLAVSNVRAANVSAVAADTHTSNALAAHMAGLIMKSLSG